MNARMDKDSTVTLEETVPILIQGRLQEDESVGEGLGRVNSSPEMCDLFG